MLKQFHLSQFLTFLFLCISTMAFAQSGSVAGTVTDIATGEPMANVNVLLVDTDFGALTDDRGNFKIADVPVGEYQLSVIADLYKAETQSISIVKSSELNVGKVEIQQLDGVNQLGAEDIIPTITLTETDLQGDGTQNVSGLLTASRDVFINAAAFTFGSYRFNIRGYDASNTSVFMNNVSMADLENGRTFWSQWGGLNDVTRGRENTVGLDPTDYAFGGVGGATNIDTRASNQWKQLRLSYSASNRSYRNRFMATYNTGLLPKKWAVSLSASRRWAQEGYIEGTHYDAWSYFAAVEKIMGDHSVNVSVFGAPTKRGKTGPSVQEAYDLAGSNYYNPNWGYLNGEKVNSREARSHLPTFIATHEWEITSTSSIMTSAAYQFGQNGSTALNWFNAPDPRPDYYRNLPSFIDDSTLLVQSQDNFLGDPNRLQIDWEGIYAVNEIDRTTIENFNGTGRDTTLNLARYMIEDRRFDRKRFNANVVYQNTIASRYTINVGANYNWQQSDNYKLVDNLLGGDYFIDLNQFAERDFPTDDNAIQNDLDNPNRLLREGDRFGYDYNITTMVANPWAQVEVKLNKFDFFASGQFTYTEFYRTGNVRNGLFPETSAGDSEKSKFYNYGVKGGLTYKINGRHYLFSNASYSTRAPFAQEAFISPRTRNELVSGLQSETIYSYEGGYLLRSPKIKARAVFYFTQFLDGLDTYGFYYDVEQNFVNITLNNIDKRHLGGEFAIEAQVAPGLKLSAVAALGQYIYNSRQEATISIDNSAEVVADGQTIYSNNFFISGTPQMATTFGINYRSPKYWFANVNFNYFDRVFINFNPIRRTEEALDLIDQSSQLFDDIVNQEEVGGQFTMDVFGGASFKLNKYFKNMKRSYYINLTVGINNITNNRNFITGGFEQTRLEQQENDLDRFPPRYFYSFGTNFFVNITFRM